MPVKVVVFKVDINCGKCNSQILEAVTEIEGVNKVSLDEGKNELTVVGTMDPVCVASKLKKIKQKPVIISVGAPKPPEPAKPKEPEKPKPPPPPAPPVCNCKHSSCRSCDVVSVNTYESGSGCTIV